MSIWISRIGQWYAQYKNLLLLAVVAVAIAAAVFTAGYFTGRSFEAPKIEIYSGIPS
jgi:hypothetical protein